jgi:hypothetical protein
VKVGFVEGEHRAGPGQEESVEPFYYWLALTTRKPTFNRCWQCL